jgi:hypothetical protein
MVGTALIVGVGEGISAWFRESPGANSRPGL